MKRDDVTGFGPTCDLDLKDKSSFLLDSLLLTFVPDGNRNRFVRQPRSLADGHSRNLIVCTLLQRVSSAALTYSAKYWEKKYRIENK